MLASGWKKSNSNADKKTSAADHHRVLGLSRVHHRRTYLLVYRPREPEPADDEL
jgi:hypothetical protein